MYTKEGAAMSEATTISAMLKSISHGPAWHGPSVSEVLEGVSATKASQKPLAGAHSIWEILLHKNAWQCPVLKVAGGPAGGGLRGDPGGVPRA